jgi:hypothetical protein
LLVSPIKTHQDDAGDVCVGGDFQRIVLSDGPRVLGHDAWDQLVERHGRGILEEWLSRAEMVTALSRLLGGLCT